jgi:hypothetical protein
VQIHSVLTSAVDKVKWTTLSFVQLATGKQSHYLFEWLMCELQDDSKICHPHSCYVLFSPQPRRLSTELHWPIPSVCPQIVIAFYSAVFLRYASEVTLKCSGFRCYILNVVKHALTSDSGISVQIFHDIV